MAVHSPLAVAGIEPNNLTQFEYDERGLLFREISAPGSGSSPTNEYSYDSNGRLRSGVIAEVTSGPRPLVATMAGQLTSITDPMSNVVSYVYDRNGNVTRLRCSGETNDVPGDVGNRLPSDTRYTYDALDRCVQQSDSFFDVATGGVIGKGTATTTFAYAPNGACTSVTDDNGHTTRYAYDTAGRCSQITDPKTNLTQFTYDAGDNLVSVVSLERPDSPGSAQQFSHVVTVTIPWAGVCRTWTMSATPTATPTIRSVVASATSIRAGTKPFAGSTIWIGVSPPSTTKARARHHHQHQSC